MVAYCQQSSKGHTGGNQETVSAENNADCGGPAQGLPEENNINTGARGHPYDIWAKKNLFVFCLCPENLPEVKLKINGLVSLSEENSG